MQHFFDRIMSRSIDYSLAVDKIFRLLQSEERIPDFGDDISLLSYIDIYLFRSLPIKGSFLDAEELLGIDTWEAWPIDPKDRFCFAAEGIASLLNQIMQVFDLRFKNNSAYEQVRETMNLIEDYVYRSGMEIKFVPHERYGPIAHVVLTSPESMAAVEAAPNERVADLVLEYGRVLDQKNVEVKKSRLRDLYFNLKPLFDKQKKGTELSGLLNDINSFVNNLDLRHPNAKATKKSEQSPFLLAMSQDELLAVYDALYAMMLSAITQINVAAFNSTINGIKEKIEEKKQNLRAPSE